MLSLSKKIGVRMDAKSKALDIVTAGVGGTVATSMEFMHNLPTVLEFLQSIIAVATLVLIVYRILLARIEYKSKKSNK